MFNKVITKINWNTAQDNLHVMKLRQIYEENAKGKSVLLKPS